LLFWVAFAVSSLLILVVILAPLGSGFFSPTFVWGRVLGLFAQDPALRRTTIASALGLLVTGCIFFRPAGPTRYILRRRRGPRVPPPNMAGA
jgi:hypothetical protein